MGLLAPAPAASGNLEISALWDQAARKTGFHRMACVCAVATGPPPRSFMVVRNGLKNLDVHFSSIRLAFEVLLIRIEDSMVGVVGNSRPEHRRSSSSCRRIGNPTRH